MRKSLIKAGVLLLIICLSLSSCGFGVIYVENVTVPTLLYEEKEYILEPNDWFNGVNENYESVNVKDDGVLLGARQDGLYLEMFYSYTEENPVYIYSNVHNAYFFREDYDPKEDTFVVDGTENSIPFTEIIAEPANNIPYKIFNIKNDPIIFLHSKTYPDLQMTLHFSFYEGAWYFWCGSYVGKKNKYRLTDEFRDFLIANNALPELLSTP